MLRPLPVLEGPRRALHSMKRIKLNLPAVLLAMSCISSPPSPASEPAANLDLARQLNQAFVQVADKVSPSVVIINVVQKLAATSSDADDDEGNYDSLPPGFWREFHKNFKGAPQETRGQGSGIILRENGFILTNRHVVEDAETIEVRLKDGRTFKATLRGSDPQSDLAVIKIDTRGLPVATFGDSSRTRVGEFAI